MSDQGPPDDSESAAGGSERSPADLWDDKGFRDRVRELAGLRGLTVREAIIGAGTSTKYMEPSAGRNTNMVMRLAKFLGCHPAYLMFGPTVTTGPGMSPLDEEGAGLPLAAGGGNAEQRIAFIAQIIASYWLHVAIDPKSASKATDAILHQIAVLLR